MAKNANARGRAAGSPVIIKKYANRRLYNTLTSSYVTLDHLARMVKDGVEFTVHDAKTDEDITRAVLTQIIVEQEAKGQNLLSIEFLRNLIGFYGDNLQGLVPKYLDVTMKTFANKQDDIRKYLDNTLGGLFPLNQVEELGRRNMALFEEAMSFFTPGARAGAKSGAADGGEPGEAPDDAGESDAAESDEGDAGNAPGDALDELKTQLHAMQRRLDELSDKKND